MNQSSPSKSQKLIRSYLISNALLTLLGLSWTQDAHSQAPDIEKKKALYLKVAKRTQQRIIFYRWQSRVSGLNLLREETITPKLYSYFMKMPLNRTTMHAGRGIYIAESIYSSIRFIRGTNEGMLIEVVVAPGTPYLDLGDPSTLRSLRAEGLRGDNAELSEVDPPLLIKYPQRDVNRATDWWIIKSAAGIKFQRFNPARLSTQSLLESYQQFKNFGDSDDVNKARAILTSRMTDAQLIETGLKRSYFYSPGQLISRMVHFRNSAQLDDSEANRLFKQLLTRRQEVSAYLRQSLLPDNWTFILKSSNWTPIEKTEFLNAIFSAQHQNDFGREWAVQWIHFLQLERDWIKPLILKSGGLGSRMANHLYSSFEAYSRSKAQADDAHVAAWLDSGPESIQDLFDYFLEPSNRTGVALVALSQTLSTPLNSYQITAYLAPSIELHQRTIRLTAEENASLAAVLDQKKSFTPDELIEWAKNFKSKARFASLVYFIKAQIPQHLQKSTYERLVSVMNAKGWSKVTQQYPHLFGDQNSVTCTATFSRQSSR